MRVLALIGAGITTLVLALPASGTHAPADLRIVAFTQKTVTVAWNPAQGATQYRLYRNGTFLSTAAATATQARFGTNNFSTTYTLGVEAVKPSGNQLSTIVVQARWVKVGGNEPPEPPPPTPPQCSNGINDDPAEDNLIDLADPGCSNAQDTTESPNPPPPPPQCSDGADNDGDAKIDLADPGCSNASDNDESDDPPPPPPPPGGLTLQQIDGGPNYYAQFTNGAAWDNPSFFPIGVWGSYAHEDANIAKDKAVGLNTYFWAADPSAGYLQNMREAGMWALPEQGGGGTSVGSETVGRVLGDEQDMTQGPSACPQAIIDDENATPDDGRFRWNNFGKGVVIWNTDAQASCWVNHPDIDVVSTDLYWHTDPFETARPQSGNSWGYGYSMQRQRTLDRRDGIVKPQMTFIEVTCPWGECNGTTVVQPTPAEIRGAVWHSLIAGSRGVEYFQHSFAGPCVTHHALRETGTSCYGAIITMVTSVNQQIASLARQLNSPFVTDGRTVTGNVEHMVKWDGSNFYVFAGGRGATTMNFSMPCVGSATASVLGEGGRVVSVVNGAFSDGFTDGNAVHIYRIDGGSSCGLNPSEPPSGGFPSVANTGPTGALTETTGNVTVTTAGTVIENRLINGCVEIRANNVTIRNTHIRCFVPYGVRHSNGNTGLVVEDTIVEGGINSGTCMALNSAAIVRRTEVFGCENLIWAEEDALIEDNYLHDPEPYDPATDPHTDGVQMPTPTSNVTIRHNTIYGSYIGGSNFGNSAITSGQSTNVLVTNNLLAGGGYTLYCPREPGGYTWTNNRFSRIFTNTVGGFGTTADCGHHTHSGNVIHETGEQVG